MDAGIRLRALLLVLVAIPIAMLAAPPSARALSFVHIMRICADEAGSGGIVPAPCAISTPPIPPPDGSLAADTDFLEVPAGGADLSDSISAGGGFAIATLSSVAGTPPSVHARVLGSHVYAVVRATWSDMISITVPGLASTDMLQVNPVLAINGRMHSFVAAPNPEPDDYAGAMVRLEAVVSIGAGYNQYISIQRFGSCGYFSTSQPFGPCNGNGLAPGPTTGTDVFMLNDGRPQPWTFLMIVEGSGEEFDSDLGSGGVHWVGFEVRDLQGTLHPDYVATSNNIDWSLSSVPEPDTLARTLAALVATAAAATGRRSRRLATTRA